mmetsp:Transcript_10814/g.23448  ORF Transcript_10814/g.23448 Transcript_10814/m.23448 type:complete len:235 (-) Transcript_10814:367-1071(-)
MAEELLVPCHEADLGNDGGCHGFHRGFAALGLGLLEHGLGHLVSKRDGVIGRGKGGHNIFEEDEGVVQNVILIEEADNHQISGGVDPSHSTMSGPRVFALGQTERGTAAVPPAVPFHGYGLFQQVHLQRQQYVAQDLMHALPVADLGMLPRVNEQDLRDPPRPFLDAVLDLCTRVLVALLLLVPLLVCSQQGCHILDTLGALEQSKVEGLPELPGFVMVQRLSQWLVLRLDSAV